MAKEKKQRGRPVVYPLPEPIDASPDEVVQVVLQMPPRLIGGSNKSPVAPSVEHRNRGDLGTQVCNPPRKPPI